MNGLIFEQNYTKDLTRYILNFTRTRFKTYLRELDAEIKAIDPKYNNMCQILKPNVFKFIIQEYGLEDYSEVNQKIKSYLSQKKAGKKP